MTMQVGSTGDQIHVQREAMRDDGKSTISKESKVWDEQQSHAPQNQQRRPQAAVARLLVLRRALDVQGGRISSPSGTIGRPFHLPK